MPQIQPQNMVSVDDYLQAEISNEIKHEYVNGQAFAMSGASPNHCKITANVCSEFHSHLKNSTCYPCSSDMKVKTSTGSYRYPDVLVVCDDDFIDNGSVTQTPTIIVEVLSRSTRKIDEREKFLEYINIASLKEYVLIEQDIADITVFRRSSNWLPNHYYLGERIHFETIDLTLSVEDIYHRVNNEDMSDFLVATSSNK
jgi:Uma2 family endonuclease